MLRPVFLLLALAALPVGAEDARALFRRAIEADRKNDEISRNYTYLERVEKRFLNGDGEVRRSKIETFDVTLTEGTPYRRLVRIDNQPLPAERERKEQEKLRKSIDERKRESPERRAKRIREWEQKREKGRKFIDELLDAMEFRLAGEESIAGRKAWVVEVTPRPGYRAKSAETKFVTKMRGRIWLDQQDHLTARLEAETIDDVSIGGFLAKLHKGTRFRLETTRVNDEVRLPFRFDIKLSARVLIAQLREELGYTFKDYRKFQAESRIVGTEAESPR
ncbi:MAG: hypothetical protein NTY38_20920 [Acidobacteria bacterium]|nr:hypothetical protein [Acidobacteriota bacterium]